MVMPQRIGGQGCLYRHTTSPEQTLTRRRTTGRQGTPAPRTSRLAVMPCRRARSCSRQNLSRHAGGDKEKTLNNGDEVGDGEEDVRGGRPFVQALGTGRLEVYQRYTWAIPAAGEAKWTGQCIARCSSRRAQRKRTPNLELGGGLRSGDSGDDVVGIEEMEEQVPVRSGRTHCGRPHKDRCLL